MFSFLATQWSAGMHGPTGLRYETFGEARRRFKVADDDWPDVCDCIQILEDEALRVMRLQAERQKHG